MQIHRRIQKKRIEKSGGSCYYNSKHKKEEVEENEKNHP